LGEGDLGTEADLELVREVGALEREDRFQVDARAADDLELVLLDRLLEGLPDEVLDRAAADLLSELALDHLRRGLAGAEALHAHVAAGLPERLPEGALEFLARNGERDPRLAGAELLDGDLHVREGGDSNPREQGIPPAGADPLRACGGLGRRGISA